MNDKKGGAASSMNAQASAPKRRKIGTERACRRRTSRYRLRASHSDAVREMATGKPAVAKLNTGL